MRNALILATFVRVLQWTWSLPSILGAFSEFFLKNYNYVIYFCYCILLVFIWAILLIYYLITKKKIERLEVEKEKFQSARYKAVIATLVVVLQWVAWILDMYCGMLLAFVYPLVLVVIWVGFLIYYLISKGI